MKVKHLIAIIILLSVLWLCFLECQAGAYTDQKIIGGELIKKQKGDIGLGTSTTTLKIYMDGSAGTLGLGTTDVYNQFTVVGSSHTGGNTYADLNSSSLDHFIRWGYNGVLGQAEIGWDNVSKIVFGHYLKANSSTMSSYALTLTPSLAAFTAAVTALSFSGIASANLLDKSATESISGNYTFTDNLSMGNGKGVKFLEAGGTNYFMLRSTPTMTSDVEMYLPGDSGTAGQAMLTDGTSNFYFGSVATGVDSTARKVLWTIAKIKGDLYETTYYRRDMLEQYNLPVSSFCVSVDSGSLSSIINFEVWMATPSVVANTFEAYYKICSTITIAAGTVYESTSTFTSAFATNNSNIIPKGSKIRVDCTDVTEGGDFTVITIAGHKQ